MGILVWREDSTNLIGENVVRYERGKKLVGTIVCDIVTFSNCISMAYSVM